MYSLDDLITYNKQLRKHHSQQGYLASHCAAAHWPDLVQNLRTAKSVATLRAAHDKYVPHSKHTASITFVPDHTMHVL